MSDDFEVCPVGTLAKLAAAQQHVQAYFSLAKSLGQHSVSSEPPSEYILRQFAAMKVEMTDTYNSLTDSVLREQNRAERAEAALAAAQEQLCGCLEIREHQDKELAYANETIEAQRVTTGHSVRLLATARARIIEECVKACQAVHDESVQTKHYGAAVGAAICRNAIRALAAPAEQNITPKRSADPRCNYNVDGWCHDTCCMREGSCKLGAKGAAEQNAAGPEVPIKICHNDKLACPLPVANKGPGDSRCEQNGVCQRVDFNKLPTLELRLKPAAPDRRTWKVRRWPENCRCEMCRGKRGETWDRRTASLTHEHPADMTLANRRMP